MKRVTLYPALVAGIAFFTIPYIQIRLLTLLIISFYLFSYTLSLLMKVLVDVERKQSCYRSYNREKSYLIITLANRGPLPIFQLAVRVSGLGTRLVNLASFSKREVEFMINTSSRGCVSSGPIEVSGTDPFALFPFKKSFRIYTELITYPRFYPPRLILSEGEQIGKQKSNNPIYEDPAQLTAIRDYRPGDAMRSINWKATARAGKLQIMDYANTFSSPVFVVMELALKSFDLKRRRVYAERSIEAAASIITAYAMKGEASGFMTQDQNGVRQIPLARGEGHLVEILEQLSTIDFCESFSQSTLDCFLNYSYLLPESCHLYILTPLYTESTIKALSMLSKKRIHISLVHTSGKVSDLPALRRVRYHSLTAYGEEYFL